MTYLVINATCECELEIYGEYETYDEALEAASILEAYGLRCDIKENKEN